MKLKAIVIAAFFALGIVTSVAVAKGPPPGKGPGDNKGKGKKEQTVSTSATGATTTPGKHAAKKMWICHRTGSTKWVKMQINKQAWPAHKAHGDVSLEAAPGSTTGTTTTTSPTGTTGTGTKAKGAGSCA